jgi:hypothetical protein
MDDVTREQHIGLHRLHRFTSQLGPLRWLLVAMILGTIIALGLGIYSFVEIQQQAERERLRANEAVATAEELCEQVRALGRECVKDPDQLRGETGPAGERGPIGPAGPPPSDGAVRAAVEAYFLAHPPAAGRAPTPAEIAAAVITYLAENPPAAGPQGPPGPPGPPPSSAQITQAIANWFITHPMPCPPGASVETITVVTPGDGHSTIDACVRS